MAPDAVSFFTRLTGVLSVPGLVTAGIITSSQFADAHPCCTTLKEAGLGPRLLYPDSPSYQSRIKSYFSINARIEPHCFVQPESTEEVAQIVKALVADEACKFAVRSGGHAMWEGASNIIDGVTIDLGRLNTTVHHPETSTASLSPGSRWQHVYESLAKDGVIVTGGRTGTVGVGGLVMGGGMSFYSARVGMVCDTVTEFEVVLASSEVVLANRDNNTDLFKALKGGAGNFGIVTRYDLETLPANDIWGGLALWNKSHTGEMIEATIAFANNVAKDPYSTSLVMWWYDPVHFPEITILSSVQNTRGEKASAFDVYFDIPQEANTTRLAPLTSFGPELEIAPDNWNIWMTATLKIDRRVMAKAIELHEEVYEKMRAAVGDQFATACEFQPLPNLFAKHSIAKGGNMLGLDERDEDLLLFTAHVSYKDMAIDEFARDLIRNVWFNPVVEYAKSINAYDRFVYLNYADKVQDPLGSYGKKNVEFIRAVASKYDPEGIFQTRTPGGFKISRVQE